MNNVEKSILETLYGSMFQDCLSHTVGEDPCAETFGRSPGQGFDHETSLVLDCTWESFCLPIVLLGGCWKKFATVASFLLPFLEIR